MPLRKERSNTRKKPVEEYQEERGITRRKGRRKARKEGEEGLGKGRKGGMTGRKERSNSS
jgi:hypothetical protein